jgi:3-methyladenine DNA glycosylase/8-oxoguanine DNA glycosylase
MDDQSTDPKESDSKPQNDHLEDVKRQAMHALTPLLADIKEMDPERKFDICMSAMRYTDNKELANAALEAALDINENGTKAEALVELINEINYLQQA